MAIAFTTAQCCARAAGVDIAKVCPECWRDLARTVKGRAAPVVPKHSLVRVDTGKVPAHLSSMTAVEARIVAPLRANKYAMLMKPSGRQNRPNDAYQSAWTGHVFVYPQAAGHRLCAAFPASPDELAASMHVVFLSATHKDADIAAMASRSPALKVGDLLCYACTQKAVVKLPITVGLISHAV